MVACGQSELLLHFDLRNQNHGIPINTIIEALDSTKDLFEAISFEIFRGRVDFTLEVLPPEPGGFIATIRQKSGLLVSGAALVVFLDSATPSGFIEGLTGKNPAGWAKSLGTEIAEIITPKQVADIHVACVKGFLELGSDELSKLKITPENFSTNAFAAKNSFYEACIQSPEVLGVGFTKSQSFPVTRDDFETHLINIPEEKEIWEIEENARIIVESPCWNKSDKRRPWKGFYDKFKTVFFTIKDENFWDVVEKDSLNLTTADEMVVQWARPRQSGRQTGQVIRVLSYNRMKISDPLSPEQVKEFSEIYSKTHNKDQLILF